ncbi:uncharacterized protein METZ01_LOCUS102096 [marine metagenome]|uniref:Aldose 1-epimerase n=1 Tax=marine metagenome TaxID=408172 RepID=A0A381W9U4_9ZZZZ
MLAIDNFKLTEISNRIIVNRLLLAAIIVLLVSCDNLPEVERIRVKSFGILDDGRNVQLFTLKNAQGTSVDIMDLGGVIVSLRTADATGNITDITTGFDHPQQYLSGSGYMGAIVGRYANRIANGRFSLDGKQYSLAKNNGDNAIHGGLIGFDKKFWHTDTESENSEASLSLTLESKDGEEGYPGNLTAKVTYTLNDRDQLIIDYSATTDKVTVINLTQHAYFNLNGHGAGSVLDQEIMINADQYTPIDNESIPTGELASVEGTPLDFRTPKPIGVNINSSHEQIRFGSGFDHNFIISHPVEGELTLAASVLSPSTGRTLNVYTDQPGIQFYTGNFLNGTLIGKEGAVYARRNAFCLETQHYPDSPNKPNFPSTILRPGEQYVTRTVFEFGVSSER